MPDVYKQITFENIVLTILAAIVLVVAIGSIYAFVRSIYMLIFSHGEAEKVKKAYSSIRFMILGVLLTVVLLFIFPLIFKWMHFPNAEEYTAKNIFGRAWEIIKTIWGMWEVVKDYQTDTSIKKYDTPTTPSQYSL